MQLDQVLVNADIERLERRFPGREGIAAAMYTQDREVLTSVYFERGRTWSRAAQRWRCHGLERQDPCARCNPTTG